MSNAGKTYRLRRNADGNVPETVTRRLVGDHRALRPCMSGVLEDEDRLIRGERPPVSHYDHAVLARAAREAAAPPFDREFWRARRADLEGAGFTTKDAVDVIAAIRASLGDTTTIGTDKGDHREAMEQAAA